MQHGVLEVFSLGRLGRLCAALRATDSQQRCDFTAKRRVNSQKLVHVRLRLDAHESFVRVPLLHRRTDVAPQSARLLLDFFVLVRARRTGQWRLEQVDELDAGERSVRGARESWS